MNFRDFLRDNVVILDGGMGTLLQARGLMPGESPEKWNITHPEEICAIHRAYYEAGSNVVSTNTFGANLLRFTECDLDEIVRCAFENAKKARLESAGGQEKFIALDIGPCGRLLAPCGDYPFEDAVALFAHTVRLGVKYGAELIIIETMNDSYETKAALLAAKENSTLPVIVTNAYGENGKLMTGADADVMVSLLEGMGADAIGANCSLGPKQLSPIVARICERASVPVAVKPNAGLPRVENGKTVFDITADEFAECVAEMVRGGARLCGGCCGTTPEHIRKTAERVGGITPVPLKNKGITVVSSYSRAVDFALEPVLIGERINPTGKKRFKQALAENDMAYILNEGIKQQEAGAHILDVNVGLPEIDEKDMLCRAVYELQGVTDLPLQIDTASYSAMEAALRLYNGKALVNSVNGKAESMAAIFPAVKKYGGTVIALTLDENGIPATADGRVEIAKRILATASEYGIDKKDIIFDTLAMAVSADNGAAKTTLEALYRIRTELGCHTSLGVSNISFGLPERDAVNSAFFAMALEKGLSAAIMNPHSAQMMRVYHAYRVLKGLDSDCADYISAIPALSVTASAVVVEQRTDNAENTLRRAIVKGVKADAAVLAAKMLDSADALSVVNDEIIPALDEVGKGYEANKIYLPQLLMSAEAAKSAFDVIKRRASAEKQSVKRCAIIMATVEGDVHDIGKNIVRLLLENYGYDVIDLGKDVPAEEIVDAAIKANAPIVGLSALMTTTVPAMEKTIGLIREKAPEIKVMVGGAVLTAEYAARIGADKYAPDAMSAVRCVEEMLAEK
ncbi:MAG: homocysteine S-methyltransferase family protein [Clostridia bacterium]|nr:homocysteine S-methyltransferase family protein [Clostridia bacterium]